MLYLLFCLELLDFSKRRDVRNTKVRSETLRCIKHVTVHMLTCSYINAAALCTAKTGILINLFPSIPHLPEKKTKHSGCLNCLYYVVESVIGKQKLLCSLGTGKNRSSVNDFVCLVVGSVFARLTMALYISNLVSFPLL